MNGESSTLPPIWFYELEGQQRGPVQAEEVRSLIAAGAIKPESLVWRSGWKDWVAVENTEFHDAMTSNPKSLETLEGECLETWYYGWEGKRVGPVPLSTMQALIADRTLNYGSMVWRGGMSVWTAMENTELADLLKEAGPPPLVSDEVNHTVVWILAVSPLASLSLQYALAVYFANGNELSAEGELAGGSYWYIPPLLTIALSYWDVSILKKAGVNVRLLGQAWLVPLYLFKRSKCLHQSPAYFWVWLVLFIISVLAR